MAGDYMFLPGASYYDKAPAQSKPKVNIAHKINPIVSRAKI